LTSDSYVVYKALTEHHNFKCQLFRIQNFHQYKAGLPIYAKKKAIMEAYKENQVLIIKSSAGSGKSTQMPQYLLDCTHSCDRNCRQGCFKGKILVTQPRVIAAESVARRVQDVGRG
jgi:HrpA-like RNA helicase